MIKITVEAEESGELEGALVRLKPEQADQLKDVRIDDGRITLRYKGIPLQLEARVTPKG